MGHHDRHRVAATDRALDPPNPVRRIHVVARCHDGVDRVLRQSLGVMSPRVDWDDLAWIRDRWEGKLAVKGVLHRDDARRAVDLGADAVVVSNHGGRQLDGVPAAVDLLPSVVDAIAGDADVLLDGGVRRGSDVVKALCLGARACLVGRPWVVGLAAGGTAGVTGVLGVLRGELARTMTLLGCPSVRELDAEYLWRHVTEAAPAAVRPGERRVR